METEQHVWNQGKDKSQLPFAVTVHFDASVDWRACPASFCRISNGYHICAQGPFFQVWFRVHQWFKIPHIASNLDLSYSSAGSCIPGPESWALFNSVMGRAWAWWCYSKSRRVTVTVIAPRFQGFHHQQGGECIFFIFLAWSAYFAYFAYFLAYFP